MDPSGVVRFADFEFDPSTRELRKRGRKAALEQKPAEMLRALVERPGELVTRAELRERLWPADVHLDFEHALNKTASKLRRALHGSAAKPRFIETLSQRGYRFIAPVEIRETSQEATVSRQVRLAVLPYENRTGEAAMDDVADGLTEETIARLGALLRGGIRVIALAPVVRYKNSSNPVAHVARELAVDCVLAGWVARGGGGYVLKLELVAGSDEEWLWGGESRASAASELTLEDSLCEEIGRALSVR